MYRSLLIFHKLKVFLEFPKNSHQIGRMDPCECLFNHEALMRRILAILRDSQTDCTDTECGTSTGGDAAAAGSNMMLIAMAWGLFAMFMFFMRPSSMRSGGSNREEDQLDGKPNASTQSGGGGNNDDNNPPPGDVF